MFRAKNPQTLVLPPDPDIPNNQMLPVLIYRVLMNPHVSDKAGRFEKIFAENGWGGIWRDGIYDYHHFHSNAHETMGVAKGNARVMLGGKTGVILELGVGDMLVLPVGTGHKRVEASEDFLVIGAYPQGQEEYDICRSVKTDPDAVQRVGWTPRAVTDPFFGHDGPLTKLWRS